MNLNRAITTGDTVRRARAMAEFEEWKFVAKFHAKRVAEIDRTDEMALGKELARRAVTLDLAQAMHVSEHQVWAIISETQVLRSKTPTVWDAFREGDIDGARVASIARTAEQLQTPEALTKLDVEAPQYAATHTVAELRAWLRRKRAQWEPEQARAERENAVEQRRVSIRHNDDGTSWLAALLPTPVAIAIGTRLRKNTKALPTIDPDTGQKDTRTRDQKQADLLAYWLTNSTGTSTDIRAEIAISIPATDLLGYTNGDGFTLDGELIGSEWVRELAQSEHTILRRLVLNPLGQVLDTTVLTYRPPQSLRQALRWRDGTCRVTGCGAPAHEADLDHALAWDSGGKTTAANLQSLCRKHHNMKSHGHLHDRHLSTPLRHTERNSPCRDADQD